MNMCADQNMQINEIIRPNCCSFRKSDNLSCLDPCIPSVLN